MIRNIISLIPEKSPGSLAQSTRKLKAKIKERKSFALPWELKKKGTNVLTISMTLTSFLEVLTSDQFSTSVTYRRQRKWLYTAFMGGCFSVECKVHKMKTIFWLLNYIGNLISVFPDGSGR